MRILLTSVLFSAFLSAVLPFRSIRKGGVNHYHAQYTTIELFCSPKVLHEVETSFRMNDHVLRFMTLKQRALPGLGMEVRKWWLPKPKDEPLDLQADAIEAAKMEYRNLVMQRVFEGRTKQASRPNPSCQPAHSHPTRSLPDPGNPIPTCGEC